MATDDIEKLKVELRKLEEDNITKEQEIGSLTRKLELVEAEVEELQDENSKLRRGENSSGSHDQTIEQLMAKITLKEEQLEKMEEDLANTTNKLRIVDVEKDNLKHLLDETQKSNRTLEENLDKANAEVVKLKAMIEEMEKQLEI